MMGRTVPTESVPNQEEKICTKDSFTESFRTPSFQHFSAFHF